MHKKSVRNLVMILVVLMVYLFTNINVYASDPNPLSQVKKRTFGVYKPGLGVNSAQDSKNTGYSDKEDDPPNANYDLYFNIKAPSNSNYNKQTSYKEGTDGAYSTHMFIDDSYSNYYHIYSDGTKKDGINVVTYVDEMAKGSDINFALVRFVIHNDNNTAKTVRVATTADIMIGADDNAPADDIKLNDKSGIPRPSGFYTTNQMCTDESADNKITLNYYFKNDYYIDQVSKNTNYTVNYNVVNWQQRFNKEVMQRNWSNGEFNTRNFWREHSGETAGGADSAFVANWVVTVPAYGTATVAYAFEVTEAKSEFTVKYDSNGGSGSIANQTAEYNEKITLSNNLDDNNKQYMTKDNYKLIGWNNVEESADKGETNYKLGDSLIVTQDTTLYAVWEAYKLKLKYDANGGYFQSDATTEQTIAAESSESLSYTEPARTGYDFKGWTNSSSWSDSATKYTNASGSKEGKDWASTFGSDVTSSDAEVTLYAQWEKKITHTFNYYNSQSTTADVIFHNDDEEQTMTIPDAARSTDKTYDGHSDWDFRGFSSGTAWNSGIDIGKDTTQLTISNSDSNTTYYAQYQRTTTITYVDYGDDAKQTNTQQETAYLNYNGGSVYSPEFKAITQNTMKYTENSVNGTKKETWSAIGWTTSTAQNADVEKKAGDSIISHKDMTYYGLYKKDVTLTYNPNGGTVSRTSDSYTRYANVSNVANATRQEYTMPTPSWKENYVTKYSFGAWTYNAYTPNSNFYEKIVGTNNNNGQFTYTPLVSDTVYAAWTNINLKSDEPNVTVTKEAAWNTPSSDNSAVDFDNKQNIDIDGIAKVTVKVNITNKNGIGAKDINVTDYFNTDMWDYYQDISPNVSTGSMSQKGSTITWTIPDNTTGTATLTYYVKIKEPYWSVDNDTNDYINKIPDLDKYLASLTDSSKNPGTANNDNFYYCSSADASKSYVWVSYKINSGKLVNTNRKIHNATPYVVMRQVNWIPTVQQVGIESDTNNIYHNIDSSYKNTYFVRYDTKGANSTFRLYELSQLKRSYSYYQITDNIMDMQSVNKTQEVIDNALGISSMRSDTWSNTTSSKLSSGFKALDLLKVSKADNIRGSVTTEGVIYPYGSLTTYDTDYATNQDGLKFSVYPFVRTTNSKQNKTFETTRNTSTLADKRLDLTIDATDPIITADNRIQTSSKEYGDWTESDGYMDINLVNKIANPTTAIKELTFKFKDEVSGVNSPDATNKDWIEKSRDNVQVTLKRVDNEPKTIFDSNDTTSNDNKYVKVTYDSTNTMNKTGNVKVTLDPKDKDVLGHLQLTIRVYDNVGNWTEKTYDLYVFCLTGAVEISDTLPNYLTRQLALNQFANGEMGVVKVSAGGYADRVTVDFGEYLDKLYKEDYSKRGSLFNDKVTTINGDYPNTDAKDASGAEYDSSMTYLPYNLQVNTWGYTSDTLGGLRLNNVEAKKYVTTVDNSILQKHLNSLIVRYQELKENKYNIDEYDNTYAILGSTLYTYPVVEKGQITSYSHKYELGGETYYNEKVYPAYITVDGTKGIDIIYNTIEGDNSKMAASVESTTEINISNWTAVGNSYLRPFIHYFYMPTEAKKVTQSNPYYVTITEYKDSEKSFKHSVNIKLSFYNDLVPRAKFIQTYIKDN
jgi:uncharacterized repeat protein (TIGR02543 family)